LIIGLFGLVDSGQLLGFYRDAHLWLGVESRFIQ